MNTTPKLRWGTSGGQYERYLERQMSEYSVQSLMFTQTKPKFFNKSFLKFSSLFISVYAAILVSAWLVWLTHPTAGTFLIVILPGFWFVSFFSVYYRQIILIIQHIRALGCVALSIFPIYLIRLAFFNVFQLPEQGFCGLCVLEKFLVAFIVNAGMETFLKYFILVILNDDLIIDPRSFFVISVCLGAGFSVLRVVYLLITDPNTSLSMALYYCFDAPLQCLTTIYMGICFADELFYEYPRSGFLCVLPPIFIHGVYLFIVEATIMEEDSVQNQLLLVLTIFVMFSMILPFVRWKFTKYGEIVLSDIREQIALGLVPHPCPSLCGTWGSHVATHQVSITESPPSNFFTPSRNYLIPTPVGGRRHNQLSPTLESTDVQFSFENGGGAMLPPSHAVVSSLGKSGRIRTLGTTPKMNNAPINSAHTRSVSSGHVPRLAPQRSIFGD